MKLFKNFANKSDFQKSVSAETNNRTLVQTERTIYFQAKRAYLKNTIKTKALWFRHFVLRLLKFLLFN